MKKLCLLFPLILSGMSLGQKTAVALSPDESTTIISVSEVKWEPLNPARGDKSPQAGTLWGDRNGTEATGFLAKFVDGFSSPPHIHNVTYRAVVISGRIHNDDPAAAKMWMSPGSFWTQPKGEVHITAAKGEENIALVEIDHGPYLVKHAEDAFDSGERPVNIDASNLVWVTPHGLSPDKDGPKVAYLWGNLGEGQSNGTFIKLPAGFQGQIQSKGSTFRVVSIQGKPAYHNEEKVILDPGSYFSSSGDATHLVSSEEGTSVLYIRTNAPYRIMPALLDGMALS